ncbi:MAG TPA: VTT domain-containing protein [Ferrovibrio sp.]|uniref:VTT domain-containing protein n=1 Tax=Ferrovibrio sp. TaxID=1917215 RepID=UPI002ED15B27
MSIEANATDIFAPAGSRPGAGRLLQPGNNVWRLERAHRAAVLIDAAAYFAALRQVLQRAQHSIYVIGWDIDSRTPLVGADGETHDDLPKTLGPFLSALVERNPELSIKLLLWDYSPLYSLEREKMPALTLQWTTPPQIELCLDKMVPIGASHHQKIVVVDDTVAFVGGLDLTVRRWDTQDHAPMDALRVDPAGSIYPPFHDVQMIVDGDAAGALGDLARKRWKRVTQERLPPLQPEEAGDPWPSSLRPHFRNATIGIARTQPHYGSEPEVREIERLFHDMVGAAERHLYIENQFLTCQAVAESLIARMRARPALEVLIVCPAGYYSWLEQQIMLSGRIRFMEGLRQAGLGDRVRLVHPHVERDGEAADVKVHSKLMIVDDRILRVGSANLCNRSIGLDTECDLVLEAADEAERQQIRCIRDTLLAEHCGAGLEEVQAALAAHDGSLFAALDRLANRAHRLQPIDDNIKSVELMAPISLVADPERPIGAEDYMPALDGDQPGQSRLATILKIGLMILIVVGLVLAWHYTPLAEMVSLDRLTESFARAAESNWALPVVLGIYALGGLVAFPVTLLIAATAAAFGTWPGLLFAAAGAVFSALVTYLVGRKLGANLLRQFMGPRIHRVARRVKDHGVLAVTMLRVMPTAPFTIVNLVAGATKIRISDYLLGTLLGLAPGILMLSALGGRLLEILHAPSLGDVLLIVGFLLGWLALSYGLQRLISRWRKAPG